MKKIEKTYKGNVYDLNDPIQLAELVDGILENDANIDDGIYRVEGDCMIFNAESGVNMQDAKDYLQDLESLENICVARTYDVEVQIMLENAPKERMELNGYMNSGTNAIVDIKKPGLYLLLAEND